MTFKHKLAKRLAMVRDTILLVSAIALVACGPRDQSFSGPTTSGLTTSSLVSGTGSPGTILFRETFEDNAFASRGWYDNTNLVTTTARHIPGSLRSLELRFPAGATTPVAGGAARRLFQPTPTLYVSYWVKYSPNWVGSGRSYDPHEFLVLSDQDGDWDGLSNNWLVTYIEHNYQNGGIPRLAMQDNKAINTSLGTLPRNLIGVTESRSTSGCNGVVEINIGTSCFNMPPWYNDKGVLAAQPAFQPTALPGYKGVWNQVEVYVQLNSVVAGLGVPDGVMQYWFNGALVIDRHDVLFRTGARPTIQFHQFVIAPSIGGGSPVDQTMWVDDLMVATAPIGSATSAPVATVAVSPSSTSMTPGATAQLAATLTDSSGNVLTGRSVTWASSSAAQATVSASGLVSGVAPGSATITATSEGRSGTATVTVRAPVASVTVSPASVSLAVGATQQLTAALKDSGGTALTGRTVTWASSGPTVANVSGSGLVTAVAAGSATITATSEGRSGSATITVMTGPPPVIVTGCPVGGFLRLVNVSTQSELTSALGAARPGDQIRIAAGTYGGAGMGRSGTSANPIVICSNANGAAILKGQFTSTGSYLVIAGLVFEGPLGSTNQVYLHGCHDVVFTRNEIRFGSYHAGLSIGDTHHMTITYNYVHHNGRDASHDHGIYFKTTTGTGNLIANNLLAYNAARGVSLHDNNGTGVYDVVVAHNTFVYNGSAGLLLNNGDRNIVVNNLFFQNGDRNANSQIRVVGSGAQGLLNGNNHQLLNNLTYSTNASRAGIDNENGSFTSGNIIGNPALVSVSDWHLRAGSPAIGLGRVGFVSFDYDLKPRVLAPDAGAYEFVP